MPVTLKVDRRLCDDGKISEKPAFISVAKGLIREISEVPPQDGGAAPIVDASGYTALPGLIDAHLHLAMHNCRTFQNYRVGQYILPRSGQMLYALFHAQLCFEMGFTTLRDMGLARSDGLIVEELCAVRDAINSGIFAGPRIQVTGWAIMTGAHLDRILPRTVARNEDHYGDGPYALRRIVRNHVRTGVDFLKTCASGGFESEGVDSEIANHTREELSAVADEAHAFKKLLAVHCFTADSQKTAIEAGADTIEHCVFTDDEAIDLIKQRNLPVIPTLAHRSDHAIELRKGMGTPKAVLEGMKRLQPACFETFQRMHGAGVSIAMGTDTGYDPGFGENAVELELYVDLGMSPLEAILTATHNAADAIGIGDRVGRLEAGKAADIVLVKGNPFENIGLLRQRQNIGLVMKDGEIFVDRITAERREVIPPSFREENKFDL